MSNIDSLDEETKRILAEVEPDAQSGSNDSKELIKSVKKPTSDDKDDGIDWETNEMETPDSEW